MKRYMFLMLAFFLSFGARADSMGISNSLGEVNFSSVVYSSNGLMNVKENSSRNINELGNISESTERAQQPSKVIPLNTQTTGVPNLAAKKGKTALSNVSCKTYEGKLYDQGEAGYNDCIRTIKTDRQKDTFVP